MLLLHYWKQNGFILWISPTNLPDYIDKTKSVGYAKLKAECGLNALSWFDNITSYMYISCYIKQKQNYTIRNLNYKNAYQLSTIPERELIQIRLRSYRCHLKLAIRGRYKNQWITATSHEIKQNNKISQLKHLTGMYKLLDRSYLIPVSSKDTIIYTGISLHNDN